MVPGCRRALEGHHRSPSPDATSGIPDYADSTLDYRRDYTEADLLRLAQGLKLAFPPGTRWSYSNTGYVLLGIVIHRVTGTFYGDLLRERIFRPLGMRTARIISEADLVPNRAAGYRFERDTLRNQEWVAPLLNTTADGSLYLTVRDLAAWAVALNHRRVPSPAGLEASWRPVTLADGGVYPYGFGWSLLPQRGYRRIGHTGSWQGFKASIQRYPAFDLTVIALANSAAARPEAISLAIAGILEPALTPPERLASWRSRDEPREPIPSLLGRIAVGSDTARLTPGLRRFTSVASRAEPWAERCRRPGTGLSSDATGPRTRSPISTPRWRSSATARGAVRAREPSPRCTTTRRGERRAWSWIHSRPGPARRRACLVYFICSIPHCAGALSGRQRRNRVPWRNRPPEK